MNFEEKNNILNIFVAFFKIIFYSLFTLIFIYNGIIISKKMFNPNEIPDFFGYRTFVIKSGSMHPTIDVGDFIIVKSIKSDDLKIGDIITYKSENSIITHRIVERKIEDKIYFITKGDYNNTVDEFESTYDDIVGKVLISIPKIGSLIIFLQNKIIYISMLVIVVFITFFKKINKG